MKPASQRLIDLLRHPDSTNNFPPADWSEIISVARAANLAGTLRERLRTSRASPPTGAQRHLDGIAQLSERQRESVHWEAHQLASALKDLAIPVVLLKGSAYVLGELPVSIGRLFGDIDILVPKSMLGDVELAMMTRGWASAKQSPYDQRYYRQWMHELPPMVNVHRGTVLDIHHTLLPLTSRHCPDPRKLIDASRELPGLAPLRIPCPQDILIHSITHLFHEGELHNGLRDLFDIDGLIRHFSNSTPKFWDTLVERAEDLELSESLFLGLHFVSRLLGTPIPANILDDCRKCSTPSTLILSLLEFLYDQGFQPIHPACESAGTSVARWLLYVRAHWLRMPPHLLSIHLTRKAWMGFFPEQRAKPNETEANGGLPP